MSVACCARPSRAHAMPLLSRLMQAMKDGVTADDLADDDDEDLIDVDGDDDSMLDEQPFSGVDLTADDDEAFA